MPSAESGAPGRPGMSTNIWWTLLGTASNSLGTWLVIVILARASGAVAVGTYAMALALTAPVMAFTSLQLRTLLASDVRQAYAFAEYVRVTVGGSVAGVLASVLVVLVAGKGDGSGGWLVIAAVCLMRVADLFADVYFALWQRYERMSVIGIGRVVQTVVSIGIVGAVALAGGGALGAAVGAALGSVALVAYLQVKTAADAEMRHAATSVREPSSWRRLGALAVQGVPLGVILLLGALQYNVPRYFLELHGGKEALGLFASAAQLTTSGNIFVGAIAGAALPRLSRWAETDAAAFASLTRKLVLAGVGLAVAGVTVSLLVGRQVLVLVYRPEFAAASQTLVVLSVAAGCGFVASFLGWALTASRVLAIQPVLLSVTLVVLVVACAILTPRYGAVGTAWALVAGSAVQAISAAVALRRSRAARRLAAGLADAA